MQPSGFVFLTGDGVLTRREGGSKGKRERREKGRGEKERGRGEAKREKERERPYSRSFCSHSPSWERVLYKTEIIDTHTHTHHLVRPEVSSKCV